MYKAHYHKKAFKQLKKLHKQDQLKIAKTINKLELNPINPELNIKPYQKSKKTLRVRIGNLRLIYSFNSVKQTVFIESLGYRGSMYRLF